MTSELARLGEVLSELSTKDDWCAGALSGRSDGAGRGAAGRYNDGVRDAGVGKPMPSVIDEDRSCGEHRVSIWVNGQN